MGLEKKITKKLQYCTKLCGVEVSALLGIEVDFPNFSIEMVDGEEYLDAQENAFVVTDMVISEDADAMGYTFVKPAAAILLGGKLIMLPDEEINERIDKEDLDEELNDSYGEVANIVAGAYTTVFIEGFVKKLHVKKEKVTLIHPLQADDSELGFLHGKWWKSTCELTIEGEPHGSFEFFFPAGLFGEEVSASDAEVISAGEKEKVNVVKKVVDADEWGAAAATEDVQAGEAEEKEAPQVESVESDESIVDNARREFVEEIEGNRKAFSDPECLAAGNIVLIVAEEGQDVAVFDGVLKERGIDIKVAGLRDNFRDLTEGHGVLGVVLALGEVSSKGMATIIKLQSELSSRIPLLAVASEWTKPMVLQAAQYGVRSIVVAPAPQAEVEKRMGELFRI